MAEWISILSLGVALVASILGPTISWVIAGRQLRASLEVSNKQVVAPMRQAWINSLRDLLAEFAGNALHYYRAGFEDRTDEEHRRLTLLEYRIALMLNPNENDHVRLEALIAFMLSDLEHEKDGGKEFFETHQELVRSSREILKHEWDRVHERIEPI